MVFASHMFPKFDAGIDKPIPENIEIWFQTMIASDDAFKKVYDEVRYYEKNELYTDVHLVRESTHGNVISLLSDDGGDSKVG